jgi:hypothetical protein
MVDAFLVLHFRDEDDFGVGSAHLLQSLQVADLHGGLAVELVCSLAHELGGLDIGPCRDDLAFGKSAFLGSGGEGVL